MREDCYLVFCCSNQQFLLRILSHHFQGILISSSIASTHTLRFHYFLPNQELSLELFVEIF